MDNRETGALLIKMKDGNEFIVDNFKTMDDRESCGMIVFRDNNDVNELWIPKDQILYIMSMHGRCTYADHIVSR
jgi:hypothetical protein